MAFDLAASLSTAEAVTAKAAAWRAVPSLKPAQSVIDDLTTQIGQAVTDVTTARDAASGLGRADLDAAVVFVVAAQTALAAV